MADEEALLVVVGVDEPGGDALGVAGADVAGVGVEHVDAVDLERDGVVALVEDVDVGLAEHDEQVALAGVLQLVGHVQVGVHLGLEDRQRPELGQLRGVGVEVEGAGDQHVEAGVGGLARGGGEIDARERAELGADQDAGAALRARLPGSGPRRRCTRPASRRGEVNVMVSRFSTWCTPAVRRCSSTMSAKSVGGVASLVRRRLPASAASVSANSSSSEGTTRCGDRLSTVNGPATRTLELSS